MFHLRLLAPLGAGAGLLLALMICILSDRWLIDLYSAVPIAEGPLRRELEAAAERLAIRDGRVYRRSRGHLPKIYVFQETYPVLFVARSLGGRGSIILSQGLLSSIRNSRVRELMELSLDRLETAGLFRVSAASVLVEAFVRWSPPGWTEWFAARALGLPLSRKLGTLSWSNALKLLLLTPFVWCFGFLATDRPWLIGSLHESARYAALRPLIGSRLVPGLSNEIPSLSVRGLCLQMPLPEA